MAQLLVVYKEIEQLRLNHERQKDRRETTISYDEKPGIQAIANLAADLAPVSGKYPKWARDYEYKRLGTVSLMAGLDLYDGRVHAIVRDRHRSREFIEFLEEVDRSYPSDWRIRIVPRQSFCPCIQGKPSSGCAVERSDLTFSLHPSMTPGLT